MTDYKEKAKELLREVETRKVKASLAIREYEERFYQKGESLSATEAADWTSKEFMELDLRNERDAVYNTIVALEILDPEEAAEYIAAVGKELGVNEVRTRL
ncbi:hypothetical protein [uncultured Dialister sp.]|uniref:hypothetical protein n=1 Tax=uncultured Dialister sp. TaxID=278064 RepID=UPI00259866CF|nr:hypothetical protein [uncultured Dialister sp.]